MSVARIASALLLGLAFQVGCNDKALDSSLAADAGKRLSAAVTPEQAAKVLARVGAHTITLGDFVAAIEHMDQFDRLRYQSPERRRELLAEMINVQLLADEAEAKGYDKDPHVQQEIRATLREAMLAQVHEGAPTSADISDAEVRGYYDSHRAQFRDPERRRVSVIALTDPTLAAATLEAARKATTATQWGELVQTRSVEPGAKGNVPVDLLGDLGLVSAGGEPQGEVNTKVPPEVRDALFRLEHVNDVYDKVVAASNHKLYIVRFTQKTEPHDRSFAEAERSIRVKLVQDKLAERETALIARLKADFPVQIDDAVLATVRVNYVDGGGGTMGGDAGSSPVPVPSAAPSHS